MAMKEGLAYYIFQIEEFDNIYFLQKKKKRFFVLNNTQRSIDGINQILGKYHAQNSKSSLGKNTCG